MIKHSLVLPILILFVISTSCSNKTKPDEPQVMGNQLFKLLKEFKNTPKEDFRRNYTDIHEIRAIGALMDPEESHKNKLTSFSKREYKNMIEDDYELIKTKSEQLGIELNNITNLDFTYETAMEGNLAIIEGKLHFKSGDENFYLTSTFFGFDNKYNLVSIDKMY